LLDQLYVLHLGGVKLLFTEPVEMEMLTRYIEENPREFERPSRSPRVTSLIQYFSRFSGSVSAIKHASVYIKRLFNMLGVRPCLCRNGGAPRLASGKHSLHKHRDAVVGGPIKYRSVVTARLVAGAQRGRRWTCPPPPGVLSASAAYWAVKIL